MLFRLLGILTEVKFEQFENAEFPINVILSGIIKEEIPVQPVKAQLSILVTPLGIFAEVIFVQPLYLQLIVCQLVLAKTVKK